MRLEPDKEGSLPSQNTTCKIEINRIAARNPGVLDGPFFGAYQGFRM
jgi:hypothetical protein